MQEFRTFLICRTNSKSSKFLQYNSVANATFRILFWLEFQEFRLTVRRPFIEKQNKSEQYYNSMWKAVQAEKESGGKQAEDFYIKSSVITDKRQKNRFLQSGVIYRNEKIRDYMNKEHFDNYISTLGNT